MKKLLFILIVILMASCKEKPRKIYTVAVSYVDGSRDTIDYFLPEKSYFFINTSNGVYELRASDEYRQHNLNADGVFKFKVIK